MLFETLLLLALAATAPADVPRYAAAPATQPVTIDGKLDDPAWSAAAWTDDFVDILGRDRPRPALRTRAKLLWDRSCLYVGIACEETDVRAAMRDRDQPLYRENAVELFLDPDDDGRDYAELEVNALGTIYDTLLNKPYSAGGRRDDAFTLEGMKLRVHVDGTLDDASDRDRGWSVEIALPWTALKGLAPASVPPRPGGAPWRMQLARSEHPRGQQRGHYTAWSPIGEVNLHAPQRWGYLLFAAEATKKQ
jgi:hypothetical protein